MFPIMSQKVHHLFAGPFKIFLQRIDETDPIRGRILAFCCFFQTFYLFFNMLLDDPSQGTFIYGIQAILAIFVLFQLIRGYYLAFFSICASLALTLLSFSFMELRISFFLSWLIPIYAFTRLLAGEKYFAYFFIIFGAALVVLLKVSGIRLFSFEMANYDNLVFWRSLLNALLSELMLIAILLFFETLRLKTEQAAHSKRVESAKIMNRVAIADLVGHLAHEVNNPLAIIQASIQQMTRGGEDSNARRSQLCSYMDESITRLEDVHQSLLVFARGEQGEAKQCITMRQFLQIVGEQFRQKCIDQTVELRLVDRTDQGAFFLRTQSLIFVLDKLMQNSIEALFHQTGPRYIHIEASQSGTQLLISVRDNGRGILAVDEPRIFELFFSRKESGIGSGRGFGLSLARSIMEVNGGGISLDRECEDTCFVLRLPIEK